MVFLILLSITTIIVSVIVTKEQKIKEERKIIESEIKLSRATAHPQKIISGYVKYDKNDKNDKNN